ncbi:MAG: immune inhibitor A [Candidatus Krumholzibacteriota bacterium]|nr:immune inhibitor A [Candidatus Krumholzibacteriota bacterium]
MAAIRFKRTAAAGLVVSVALLAAAGTASAGEPEARVLRRTASGHLVPTGRTATRPTKPNWRRVLVEGDRLSRGPLPRPFGERPLLGAAAAATGGTVRAILIRVDFLTDRLDQLSSLSTGGGFDLAAGGTSLVDPTPHDRAYFDAHMEALATYYRLQSCGAVEIEWIVWPPENDAACHLGDIADYGPGEGGDWKTESLVCFFRDAVTACDADLASRGYPERIGDFDAIVVAHAGPNLQTDVNYDTPNDIPSFYARLGDEDIFTVDGGATTVRYGSVIPETANQDGYLSGIAAVLAHEFGHQLGLPDLYNVQTNAPTVGIWDNMDSGGMLGVYVCDETGENCAYAEGLVPGGLSAWSRTYLGWTTVDTVATFAEGIALTAVERCPARVVRVEAGEDEYFLVENRAAETDGLPTYFVADGETGVILGTGNCLNCDDPGAEILEWELVNGYDILLPTESDYPGPDGGPGLLVWHVDDRLIAERWETNTVNTLYPYGVSLVEANGVVDLGDPYSWFGLGWFDDAFYEGNATAMGDSILPPSWSNLLVPSGVFLENVSARDTLMTFDVGVPALRRVDRILPSGRFSPAADGVLLVPGGEALLLDEAGDLRIAGLDEPVFSLGAGANGPIAWIDDPDADGGVILAGTAGGDLWLVDDRDFDPLAGWPVSSGVALAAPPVLVSTAAGIVAAVTTADGVLHCLDAGGGEIAGSPIDLGGFGTRPVGNIAAAVDSLGRTDALFVLAADEANTWVGRWEIVVESVGGASTPRLDGAGDGSYGYPVPLSRTEVEGEVALVGGDVDPAAPGAEIWVVAMTTGRLFLLGRDGILASRDREKRIAARPALHDLDGDGWLDLVYPDGRDLCAVTASGANLTGWPRRPADEYYVRGDETIVTSPVVLATAHGPIVAAGSELGALYLFDGAGRLLRGWPRRIAASFPNGVDLVPDAGGETLVAALDLRDRAAAEPAFPAMTGGCSFRWRALPAVALSGSWTGAWGGPQRTAFAQPSAGGAAGADEWLALDRTLVVYPNPSTGEAVRFHFPAPATGEARLEIMTLTGELVFGLSRVVGGGEAEFVVDLSGKASGVYLCRLVVTAGGRRTQATRTFAIVH